MSDISRVVERCGAVAKELRKLAARNKSIGPKLECLADVLEDRRPAADVFVDLDKRVSGARRTA